MRDVKLTIRNYRCFDESHPLVIDIGRNYTALVGPNNSGKSSLLKFFYEFRNLWGHLSGNLPNLSSARQQVSLLAVADPEEMFSNTNDRPLTIDVELVGSDENTQNPRRIVRVVCACSRNEPYFWSFHLYSGENRKKPITGMSWSEPYKTINGSDGSVYDCVDFVDVAKLFQGALYIGPFRNAINEGAGSYYDLAIGSAFITTWNSWKTGGMKAQNRAVEAVTSDIRKIFDYERIEINASQDQKTLSIYIDGKPYRLPELGAGLAQFIIVLGNAAIRKPSLLLIDEPELNLHPSLQIDFLTSLGSYASSAVIFATHSIGLARTTADRIYSFQKGSSGSVVKIFDQTPNYAEFVGEMSFSTFKEMGCDQILLVEGVHDVRTIQQFLRMLRKDHRVVIIPLGGNQLAKGGVEIELAELKRLSNNVSALVDSERISEDGVPIAERVAFEEMCEKLGIRCCVTHRRSIENYFTDAAVKENCGEKYTALGPYESLRDAKNGWSKTDNWRIARRMKFEDIETTDLGQFLSGL